MIVVVIDDGIVAMDLGLVVANCTLLRHDSGGKRRHMRDKGPGTESRRHVHGGASLGRGGVAGGKEDGGRELVDHFGHEDAVRGVFFVYASVESNTERYSLFFCAHPLPRRPSSK